MSDLGLGRSLQEVFQGERRKKGGRTPLLEINEKLATKARSASQEASGSLIFKMGGRTWAKFQDMHSPEVADDELDQAVALIAKAALACGLTPRDYLDGATVPEKTVAALSVFEFTSHIRACRMCAVCTKPVLARLYHEA